MIRLEGWYAIEAEKLCYTLGIPVTNKVVDKKTGKEKTVEVMTEPRYYSNLDQALLGYWKIMRRKKLANFEGSLQDALDVVKKQDERIRKLIEKVKEGNK